MTDQITFPPLHEPAPGELERRKQHLLSEIRRESERRGLSLTSFPQRRVASVRPVLAIGVAVVAAAAIAVAVTLTGQSSSPRQGPAGILCPGSGTGLLGGCAGALLVRPVTIDQPLGPQASQISLADAPTALGGPVTVPNTALASSANVGSVWTANYGGDDAIVAVTFPQAGLVVEYQRPVQTPPSIYQSLAQEHSSLMSVTDLSGVPALVVAQNSDQTGTNFGAVEFVSGGTTIGVLGHYDEATLKTVAQSIVDQSAGS